MLNITYPQGCHVGIAVGGKKNAVTLRDRSEMAETINSPRRLIIGFVFTDLHSVLSS
jgi:hypothetical protein